ncbi:histidine kinase [Paenibacillus sp. LHD-117]|uniref:sensor histidine kinase n=1 Tax=Paenibacillus sp. LHD-117 TaxID=3071412 RepID=UPI0027E012D0|nr:histidine kinase [Paenibacillus sp. LHD-117]MDQ6421350.1 histidine kinase [Paenibacillus sp. LHD-117]
MKLQAAGKAKWFVYQKIVVVFVVLLIPLFSINIWVNFKAISFSKNTIVDSAMAGLSFYANQLDKEMYFIRNQQLQFLNDSDLQKLSFLGGSLKGYEEVLLIQQVKDRLVPILESSEYVTNAGVYIASIDKTISSISGVTNAPNAEYELISSLSVTSPKPSFYSVGESIFFIEVENNAGIWSYIEISKSKLLDALRQTATLSRDSEVFLGSESLGSLISTAGHDRTMAFEHQLLQELDGLDEHDSKMKNVEGIRYFVAHNNIGSLNLSLIMYVNQNEITKQLSQFNLLFYFLFGIAFVVLVLYSFSVNLMIHRPLSKLVKAFHKIETDNLNLVGESKRNDEFHYLFHSFNRMAHRLKRSIEENYGQKIALQHSELKQLQSQINPHFLYNSFYNIYMMCKVGDSDSAANLSQKLGNYYQYITRSGANEVLLSKEFQHALDYCEIQCIRFSNRVSYEYTEIPQRLYSVYVPRLIIQPIVENVFDHAFEDGAPDRMIYLDASYMDDTVRITVEDNGQLLTDAKLEQLQEQLATSSQQIEKTGLINVSNRLELTYGAGSGLFVSRSRHGGLKVELIIHVQQKGASSCIDC